MRAIARFGLLVALLAMTGCGSEPAGSPSTAPSGPSTPAATPADPTTPATTPAGQLTITARDASGTTTSWTLSCDPPGGTHPDPETACRVLDQNGATALPAVPKDRMCAQVYGGPETATITGSWRGQPVTSRLSRVNGCETSRWSALEGLLPKAGA